MKSLVNWRRSVLTIAVMCMAAVFSHQMVIAQDDPNGGGPGGGDVFPHYCVSFAGKWKSDAGGLYNIEQKKCEHIVIARQDSVDANMIELVPDNKEREIAGGDFHGTARHAWNSLDYGTSITMNLRYIFDDRIESEVRTFEYVNYFLILESVHRTIEDLKTGEVRRISTQDLYRRCRQTPVQQNGPRQDAAQVGGFSGGPQATCDQDVSQD